MNPRLRGVVGYHVCFTVLHRMRSYKVPGSNPGAIIFCYLSLHLWTPLIKHACVHDLVKGFSRCRAAPRELARLERLGPRPVKEIYPSLSVLVVVCREAGFIKPPTNP